MTTESTPIGEVTADPGESTSATAPIDPTAMATTTTTTYDLLQARLGAIAAQLRSASDQLNAARTEAFSSVALQLAEQDRVRTDQACVPRDAICVGDLLVLGANIPPGLATQRSVADVFTLFRSKQVGPTDWEFSNVTAEDPDYFLGDPSFQRDFQEIYRYYAEARLISQELRGDELLMVFGIGSSDDDVRVLRWRVRMGAPAYIDANGEHDRGMNRRYDFLWTDVGRDRLIEGRWPHYNLDDQLFMGATRGVLEFRIDDAVAGGRTILTERLAEVEADLGEMKTAQVRLGDLILVRTLPYREVDERFYIFNRLTREIVRIDALARGCHQLPEGQGVVFPGGFHLQNGETRVFATDATGYNLVQSHRSPNGEDILYVYERISTGSEMLLAYNVVTREMATPVICHGYALFDDGTIVCVREATEAQRIHTIAVYISPFCTAERYAPAVASGSFFGRIGNPELVHALGETLSLARAASEANFNAAIFEALVARSNKVLDSYSWLDEPEAQGIGGLLVQLRKSAGAVLDEFASVTAAKRDASAKVDTATTAVLDFLARADLGVRDTDAYIELMADARSQLGALSQLDEVRYVDRTIVEGLRDRVQHMYANLGIRAVDFLDDPAALDTQITRLADAELRAASSATSAQVGELTASIDQVGDRLVLLAEVVGGLDVADVTRKTSVLTRLSSAIAQRNGARAVLDARSVALRSDEAVAGFTAAMSVLSQRAIASLSSVATATDCDTALAAISADLENAELAYGDVPTFADAIDVKRNELYEAFSRRRDSLASERTRKIDRIAESAARVLATVTNRSASLVDRTEVDGFFATDPLVTKIRKSIDDLRSLGEAGRAGELDVALVSARDSARRSATDRAELFDGGTVKIGKWRIGTNAEPFELRLMANAAGDGFEVRLTGTDLALPVISGELSSYVDLAEQTYISENATVSRAEYLAFSAFANNVAPSEIAAFAASRLEEGYEPGVHDVDAERILNACLPVLTKDGLRFSGAVRAVAGQWLSTQAPEGRSAIERKLSAIRALGDGHARRDFVTSHGRSIAALADEAGLSVDVGAVVEALAHAEQSGVAQPAERLAQDVERWAAVNGLRCAEASFGDLVRWIQDLHPGVSIDEASEAAWKLAQPGTAVMVGISSKVTIDGLRSRHPRIVNGALTIDVGSTFTAFTSYQRDGTARFAQFSSVRAKELDHMRAYLSTDRLRTKVLPSFVRNRLIDEVYLPLIGNNVARQLGMNGAAQGLLLLISPPGYGKTTLVEYVADLLGFAMVKINGPTLGSMVTSLDPAAAPDKAAGEELAKLNRAFAMGTNVVCYLDDIQHTSPELLQKFISLCDATRRVEGVLEGSPRTYELAGKRFVMVMAGNPYTSSGEAFRIPDMLANRADVYNLGDVASGAEDAFAQSYIENACGVNEVLAPVLSRGRSDLTQLLAAASGGQLRSDQLSYPYSAGELSAILKTLTHLVAVRDALLKVNAAYIRSATLDDAMRGEPPFLLQGSYRNMARIAQRVVAAMTSEEVATVIADHYRSESQTLAAAAGWNMAKLSEILGIATTEQRAVVDGLRERWNDANVGSDPMQVMAGALRGIESAMRKAGSGQHPGYPEQHQTV